MHDKEGQQIEDLYTEFKLFVRQGSAALRLVRMDTKRTLGFQESIHETMKLIADTAEKGEKRQARLEAIAVGKDQIPLKTHYVTVGIVALWSLALTLGGVIGILYITNTNITGTLSSIQINQAKALQNQAEVKKALEKVEEIVK